MLKAMLPNGQTLEVPWEAVVGCQPCPIPGPNGSVLEGVNVVVVLPPMPVSMDRFLELWKRELTRPRLHIPTGPVPEVG